MNPDCLPVLKINLKYALGSAAVEHRSKENWHCLQKLSFCTGAAPRPARLGHCIALTSDIFQTMCWYLARTDRDTAVINLNIGDNILGRRDVAGEAGCQSVSRRGGGHHHCPA